MTRHLKPVPVDRRYTKHEIFTFYACLPYFGTVNGKEIIGVSDAARVFAGVSAKELTLDQAADVVAHIESLNQPAVGTLADRRQHVLDSMREEGFITPDEFERARQPAPRRSQSAERG